MGLKVFVYGTLKPGECNYPFYCAKSIVEKIQAYTWGNLYHLPLGYPGMTLGKSKTFGFVLTFANEEILASLDRLEDYEPGRSPQENEYQRQKILAYDLSGEALGEVWGYLMNLERVKQLEGVFLPSGWWTGNKSQ